MAKSARNLEGVARPRRQRHRGRRPATGAEVADRMVNLFQRLTKPPRKNMVGLAGELLVIRAATDPFRVTRPVCEGRMAQPTPFETKKAPLGALVRIRHLKVAVRKRLRSNLLWARRIVTWFLADRIRRVFQPDWRGSAPGSAEAFQGLLDRRPSRRPARYRSMDRRQRR